MSSVVYLIGHGRVDESAPACVLPGNFTMHWLAPLGDVTKGMSHAFLNGRLVATPGGQSDPTTAIPEHYLCPEAADVDPQTDLKIKNFFSRNTDHPHGCKNPWVLYTRAKVNVSLSSIIYFLAKLGFNMDWHLYWTCCRGFIGQHNPYETKFVQGSVKREARVKPPKTQGLTDQGHQVRSASFETVVIVSKGDKDAIEAEGAFTVGKGKYATKGAYSAAIKAILEF